MFLLFQRPAWSPWPSKDGSAVLSGLIDLKHRVISGRPFGTYQIAANRVFRTP